MNNYGTAVVFLVVSLIFGCALDSQNIRDIAVVPPDDPLFVSAKASAVPCASPVAAKITVSSKFRYGCFCGGGWPDNNVLGLPPNPTPDAQLTEQERKERIAMYYRIKPYDEIDSACQAHDVCWLMHGHPELACNDALSKSMRHISSGLRHEVSFFDTDSRQTRCSSLADDIGTAATIAMKRGSADPWAADASWTNFFVTAPVSAIYMGLLEVGKVLDVYPLENQVCSRGISDQ